METEYISCTETAKLMRVALKRAFPRVKFSVRSSPGRGSSINVSWEDGPNVKMVEAIADQYQGGGFDGMVDLEYSVKSWLLPDGSATPARCEGTTDSRGTVAPFSAPPPTLDARLVRFGATYVFCQRQYSAPFMRRALEALARRRGDIAELLGTIPPDAVTPSNFGASLKSELARLRGPTWPGGDDLQTELCRALQSRAQLPAAT